MLVSYRHEFAYISVPHVCDSIVARSLRSFCENSVTENWHRRALKSFGFGDANTAAYLKQKLSASLFRSLFKFTFVRNPWDLLVANYHHIQADSQNRWHSRVSSMPFDKFVDFAAYQGIGSQLDMVAGGDGELLIDFVGHYESLEADFFELQKQIGIIVSLDCPVQSRHADFRMFYDEELIAKVSRLFARDIDAFGYSFDAGDDFRSDDRRIAA